MDDSHIGYITKFEKKTLLLAIIIFYCKILHALFGDFQSKNLEIATQQCSKKIQ